MWAKNRIGLVLGVGLVGVAVIAAGLQSDRSAWASPPEENGIPTTYRLHRGPAEYDASPQIDAYAQLVFQTYRKAAADAALMQLAIVALLEAPRLPGRWARMAHAAALGHRAGGDRQRPH